jgi:hypothetical protein
MSNSTLFIAQCPSFTADQKDEKDAREQPVQTFKNFVGDAS